MARWGGAQIYAPEVQGNKLAQWFLKIFGTVDTGSSHLHFTRTTKRVADEFGLCHALDAGCDKGKYSFWLAQAYPNAQIDAFDLSAGKIASCQEVQLCLGAPNIRFFVQNLLTYQGEGTYDFVFTNHVLEHVVENRLAIANLISGLRGWGIIYVALPNAVQRRLPLGRRFVQSHEEWAKTEHIGQTLTLESLSAELKGLGCKILVAKHTSGFWDELRFELQEMALNYFHSRALFAVLYPLLRLLGIMDTWMEYADGNGILVLAQKNRLLEVR
jgi:SAM-dependent methyltransferase